MAFGFAILAFVTAWGLAFQAVVEHPNNIEFTAAQLGSMIVTIQDYHHRVGRLPSQLDDFGNAESVRLKDAWKRQLRYAPEGSGADAFVVWSLGPDGLNDTGDDMTARPGREIPRPSYRPDVRTIGMCLVASVALVSVICVRRKAATAEQYAD